MKTLFITWGAGFIGSHFLNTFVPLHHDIFFVNLDSLTYAGDISRIEASVQGSTNYIFEEVDIRERKLLQSLYKKYTPSGTIHFAAESHVDRSIASADIFLETNIFGTKNLLESHKKYASWRFHYVSTDEVYGDIPWNYLSKEIDILNPSSPYSASKAGAEMFVMSYGRTYWIDYTISRGSNTYGTHQHTEKLIPYALQQLKEWKKIWLYGDGENIRDWLSVDDHTRAIWEIFTRGKSGNIYNIGARNLKTNNEVIWNILSYLKQNDSSLEYVIDRLGHDRRYALDTSKIREELDWVPKSNFEEELSNIIHYHFSHDS